MPPDVRICPSCGATLASQHEPCAFCGVELATASSQVYDNVMVSFQWLKARGWGVQLRDGKSIGFASESESYELYCGEPWDKDGLSVYYVQRFVPVDFDALARDVSGFLPKHSQPKSDLTSLEQMVNCRRTGVKLIWFDHDLMSVRFASGFTTAIPSVPRYLGFAIAVIRNEHDYALGPTPGSLSRMYSLIRERVRHPCQVCDRVESHCQCSYFSP